MGWQEIKHWILPVTREPGVPRVEPGLYHYQRARDGAWVRFHLRVDRDGSGLLIAGAAEAVRLTFAGVFVARGLLEGRDAETLARELGSRSPGDAVRESVDEVQRVLADLSAPSGRYPIFNLGDPSVEDVPDLLAPFQADVELAARDQRAILSRLWEAGVPHVRFRCGTELDAAALVEAVEAAEDLGMIAGVRGTAAAWAAGDLLDRLARVGLDYAVIPWVIEEELHDALLGAGDFEAVPAVIDRVRRLEMCPLVEIPLVEGTFERLEEGIDALVAWRVENVEVYAVAEDRVPDPSSASDPQRPLAGEELRQVAAWVEDLSQKHPLQIVWAAPVERSGDASLAAQVLRGPRTGSDVSIRVDAQGNVCPPRGPEIEAGNLLEDSWEAIWEHAAFRKFRGRIEQATRCPRCPGLAICAAACPADPEGWSRPAAAASRTRGGE